jgi:hypothetical protein
MNDNTLNEDRPQGGAQTVGARPEDRRSRRSFLVRVGVALLLGLLAVGTVYRLVRVPPSPYGLSEWTLHFPGPSPGATFRTAPGDDVRGMLDTLLVDAGADWEGELRKAGTIRIVLTEASPVPLGVRLFWRFIGAKGSPPPDKISQLVLAMELRRTPTEPARYELVRLGPKSSETVIGTFDEFATAQDAILDRLAEAMKAAQAK